MARVDFVIIAGPTASGKSALALALAQQQQGIVINADSMQVYDGLPILTAAPDEGMRGVVPHYLFGHREANQPYSVGQWLEEAGEVYAKYAKTQKRLAILVGGSGLYVKAALNGIAPIPPIPSSVRATARDMLGEFGSSGLYEKLKECDPDLAAITKPSDRQRLVRGMEVWLATGKGLSVWQKSRREGALAGTGKIIYVRPPRDALYQRINHRLDVMLQQGVMDEIRSFKQNYMSHIADDVAGGLPILKAVGLKPLMAAVTGEKPLDLAMDEAKRDSRHYAKRQFTWFDNQLELDAGDRTLLRVEEVLDEAGASRLASGII